MGDGGGDGSAATACGILDFDGSGVDRCVCVDVHA